MTSVCLVSLGKPRALKTPGSLFIHYITAYLLCDTLIFYQGFNEIDAYLKKFTFVLLLHKKLLLALFVAISISFLP